MTPESVIANTLTTAVEKVGGITRKLSYEGRIGAPDYLVMIGGRLYFVETKAPGERPRVSQIREFDAIRAHAHETVFVVDSVDAIARFIRCVTNDVLPMSLSYVRFK